MQRQGRKAEGELFLLLVKRKAEPATRVGITVSSRVGNAVVRNRVKRWVREYVRRHGEELPTAADLVILARVSAGLADHRRVDQDLRTLLARVRENR